MTDLRHDLAAGLGCHRGPYTNYRDKCGLLYYSRIINTSASSAAATGASRTAPAVPVPSIAARQKGGFDVDPADSSASARATPQRFAATVP